MMVAPSGSDPERRERWRTRGNGERLYTVEIKKLPSISKMTECRIGVGVERL